MTDDMIERVARAIQRAAVEWVAADGPEGKCFEHLARAAIAATRPD
jgi:hypothetical protein